MAFTLGALPGKARGQELPAPSFTVRRRRPGGRSNGPPAPRLVGQSRPRILGCSGRKAPVPGAEPPSASSRLKPAITGDGRCARARRPSFLCHLPSSSASAWVSPTLQMEKLRVVSSPRVTPLVRSRAGVQTHASACFSQSTPV